MKAIRKSDGKIIEVEIYMLNSRRAKNGLWESSYKDNSSGLVYEASNLDFSVNKTKEAEGEVLSGWVARDDGERWHERELHLFTRNKPERRKLMGDWVGRPSMTLDSNLFPSLTWDSEPMEVEITIKPKKKSSTK